MSEDEIELPLGWASATIGELIPHSGVFIDGDWVESKDQDPDGDVRLIQLADIGDGAFHDKSSRFLTTEKARALNCTFLEKGDILIARMPDPLGRCCIFPLSGQGRFVTVVDVCVVRLGTTSGSSKYLSYLINSPKARGDIGALQSGSTRKRISRGNLATIEMPIAPRPEQDRIVAKIEELFSELDKGVESLTAAREQLKVYRQAVLKHAFEGKLTAQWREENENNLETPDQLLARIKREREARYQRQLSDWHGAVKDWEAKGHKGNKPTKPQEPGNLHQLNADELALLPPLPSGYVYTYLANLGDLARGKSKHRPRNDPRLFGGEYPFIQTGEVKAANRVIRDYSQTYNEVGLTQSLIWPKGTLCITIAANIAQTAFLGFDACFPDSVVGFSPFEPIVLPEYVELFIKAVRVRIEAYAPATAQKNINLTILEKLIVPYCSLDEQRRLVGQVESLLSVVDENDSEIETALLRCAALRQSILKKAFTGQLVTQDPNDEPASALLERIRAEKAEREKGHKNNKRKDAA